MMIAEKEEQPMEIMYRQMGAAMGHDMLDKAKNIMAPTLVICGDEDLIAPIENSRFFAREIPDSRLVELPGGHHAFWIERADEACEAIEDFLSAKT